jgi:hypothetical protein
MSYFIGFLRSSDHHESYVQKLVAQRANAPWLHILWIIFLHGVFTEVAIEHSKALQRDLRYSSGEPVLSRWPRLKSNGPSSRKRHLCTEIQCNDASEKARTVALVVLRAEAELSKSFERITSNKTAFRLSFSF